MMNNDIKISVVVPVYNVEKYIRECVESLIQQTIQNIEILLIDDGSTDLSGCICDEFVEKNSNIRVVHKENKGLGSARNVGFKESKGKYVYFIDSDDVLDKNALEFLYMEAEKDNLDIILFSAECFSDDEEIEYNANQYKRSAFLDTIQNGVDLFFNLYTVKEYYPAIPLRFYNREFLINNNFVFPEGIIHEDEVYGCLSLMVAERVKCISNDFYKRRYRKGSIITSNKAYNSALGCIYTWKKLLDSYLNLELCEEYKGKYLRFINGFLYKTIKLYFASFNAKDKKKFKNIRKEIVNTRYYNTVDIGLKIFFKSPVLYKVFEKVVHSRGMGYRMKRGAQHKLIFMQAVLKLFVVHTFCRDKSAVILIGTPTHGNLGDQAIVYAEHKFFQRFKKKMNIVEICSSHYLEYKEFIKKVVEPQDLIVIDGGGSMGTLWIKNEYRFRDIIERFPKNKIFMLPQTAFFSNDAQGIKELRKSVDVYSKHDDLVIFCRDKSTYEFICENFSKNATYYIPDMVLSIQYNGRNNECRSGVLLCLREDKECIIKDSLQESIKEVLISKGITLRNTSTLIEGYVNRFNRDKELQKKWLEFANAKLVITDRLHAMLFCAITKTPCIAFDNVSHKVRGGYEWIKTLPYIFFCNTEVPSEEIINSILDSNYEKENLDLSFKYDELQKIIEGGN